MNEIEKLIESLPVNIQKKVKVKCSCGRDYEKTVTYELRIKHKRSYGLEGHVRQMYYIYYVCPSWDVDSINKYISTHTGMGFQTIKEAIEDLKKFDKVNNEKN